MSQARGFAFDAPALALARALYGELAAQGYADEGTQSLFRIVDR